MDWVKLGSGYFLDVAIACLDDAGEVMFLRGLAFCGASESGGFIPAAMLPTLGRRNQTKTAGTLVTAKLWEASDGGFRVQQWEKWQAELETLIARRKRDAERKRRGRGRGQSADDPPDVSADAGADRRRTESRGEKETTTDVVVVRDDVDRICDHLADRIEANGSKRPNVGERWRTAARLLLDADGRSEAQVHTAIDWCQGDEFWRAVVLSMPALREKYDQMRLAAERARAPGKPSTTDQRVAQGLELVAQLKSERTTA